MISKSHQAGAEIKNSDTKARGLRVSNEWPLRLKTRASTVRQYPNHMGKKPQWVREPERDQFVIQNTIVKAMPIQPYIGQCRECDVSFDSIFGIPEIMQGPGLQCSKILICLSRRLPFFEYLLKKYKKCNR